MYYAKQKHRDLKCRSYKNSANGEIIRDLLAELSFKSYNLQRDEFDKFKYLASKLSETLLFEEKHVRYNRAPSVSNSLHKAIMAPLRLLNKFKKNKTKENQCAYRKQRNYCVKLLKISKENFCNNVNANKITHSETF